MRSFKDKNAFITGGSTGIGLAVAKALAAEGCHVSVFARSVFKLELAKDQILEQAAASVKVKVYSMDASDPQQVQHTFARAVEENGIPDLLINCVGIAQPDHFENISFESFDTTLKTNLYSTWNTVHEIVPYMKAKGGHIVNTSSIAGFLGVFGYTDYCMTKFGILGFSEALKSEMKRFNIGVSVLCPPDTDTPGFEAENKNKPEETKAIAGNAKLLQPETVAKALLSGIRKDKFLIIPGADGKLTYYLKRFFPWLVEMVMNSSIQKVQRKK